MNDEDEDFLDNEEVREMYRIDMCAAVVVTVLNALIHDNVSGSSTPCAYYVSSDDMLQIFIGPYCVWDFEENTPEELDVAFCLEQFAEEIRDFYRMAKACLKAVERKKRRGQ